MKKASWLLAAVCALAGSLDGRAQFAIGDLSLKFGPSPSYSRNPYAYLHRYRGADGWSGHHSHSVRVSYFYYSAPMVVVAPSAEVAPRPAAIILKDEEELDLLVPRLPRVVEVPRPVQPLAPGAEASVFRPIRPEDRVRAERPERAEVAPRPRPDAPRAKKPPDARERAPRREPPPLPAPPRPEANPKAESDRQIRFGKEAFIEQEYGRAERRFQEAVVARPDGWDAYFLLAQAQFALGKYQEAVLSIQNGLRRQPLWPLVGFRLRQLYGPNIPDQAEQFGRLSDALARFPYDPFLVFLHAYQLWFDDRQDEARPFFARAKTLGAEPRFTEAFLQPVPPWPFVPW